MYEKKFYWNPDLVVWEQIFKRNQTSGYAGRGLLEIHSHTDRKKLISSIQSMSDFIKC